MTEPGTLELTEVTQQNPPACRGRIQGLPCPNTPVWDVVLSCSNGHLGGGPACDTHREPPEYARHTVDGCNGAVTIVTCMPL